jgi:hypothetical protein
MELTLEAVAKDAFRRDLFLRCFSEREAQALELRFAFLHRVRQYKRLVGRRDLLPRAVSDSARPVWSHLPTSFNMNVLLRQRTSRPRICSKWRPPTSCCCLHAPSLCALECWLRWLRRIARWICSMGWRRSCGSS